MFINVLFLLIMFCLEKNVHHQYFLKEHIPIDPSPELQKAKEPFLSAFSLS